MLTALVANHSISVFTLAIMVKSDFLDAVRILKKGWFVATTNKNITVLEFQVSDVWHTEILQSLYPIV